MSVEEVLRVVAAIPPGNVSTYGEVGKVASVGARYVGWALGAHGDDVPWWRVVRADGTTHDPERACPRWEAEGIGQLKPGRADLRAHGLDAKDLAR